METTPSVEFFENITEQITDVRLRRNTRTGVRSAVFIFQELQAINQFKSYTNRFNKALKLVDSEGEILVEPASVQFVFGGPEGDDLERVECRLEIDREDHWERLMRFMQRYAAANGMAYGERGES